MNLEMKKVELKDRDWMTEYLDLKQDKGCDMCFPNLYLWSRKYQIGYSTLENCLIFGRYPEPNSVSFPYGKAEDVKQAILKLEELFSAAEKPFVLHLVTPSDFALLESWFPGKYKIEYERDIADYVYDSEKLMTLSGRKYHSKKNHVNKFKQLYPDWSYEPITHDNVEECFQMALKWRELNGCEEDDDKRDEMCVTLNALRLMKELRLTGGLLRADGQVVAFSIGEELNRDMFVVHIEKAFSDVPGAYPMINQQFVLHEGKDYPYINREDDSGVPGLRKAKESYHPVYMMEKGLVTLA